MIHVDLPSVEDEQEALSLMIYHLKMAAGYFEASPTEIPVGAVSDTFSFPAIAAWIKEMEGLYPDD